MSGYVPVFDTVFQGTLCGRWPDSGVWLCLLALADRHGNIDMTVPYISAVTGVPADVLTGCIERFMQPDPCSRSKDEEGRRLVRLDAGREWGWKIVNHSKYREKARKQAYDAERTASGKDADRKRESREVPTCPAKSREVPLSDSDSDSDSEKTHAATFAEVKRLYPKRSGSHRWGDAERFLGKRLREGHSPETILAGVRRYAAYVKVEGIEGSSVVQQAATFLGDNKGFLEEFVPSPKGKTNGSNPYRGSLGPSE